MSRRRKSRRKHALPKGAYRLPTRGVMLAPTVLRDGAGQAIRIRGALRNNEERWLRFSSAPHSGGRDDVDLRDGQTEQAPVAGCIESAACPAEGERPCASDVDADHDPKRL